MNETTYSYETLPGQTLLRTCQDGYTWDELLAELRNNGDGVIVDTDEGRSDERIASVAGRDARSL